MRNRMALQLCFIGVMLFSVSLVGGCSSGQRTTSRDTAPMSDEERLLAIQSFDQVWETVRDKHYDPNINGVDWNAVRAELRPKVESAGTMAEARGYMQEALDRLGQSHFGIIPGEAYRGVTGAAKKDADDATAIGSETAEEESPGEGATGIHPRVSKGSAYVFSVDPGSPAEAAGVRPGWRIVKVNQRSIDPVLATVLETYQGQVKQLSMASSTALAMLSGEDGETITVEFRDGSNKPVRKEITLTEPAGAPFKFGNLPTLHLSYSARRLPGGAGYIYLSIFFEPAEVMQWFGERVKEFAASNAPGIIIDLRGNIGGIGAMAMGIGGWFVQEPNQKLGTMSNRAGTINFVLNPRLDNYKGPLAILIDERSMSTSEIAAGGLQAIKRARIFGENSPGMALPSGIARLPNGDGFQYVLANYISADGRQLEGNGVIPDDRVPLDPKALLQGRDPVLEAAERWIASQ